MNRNSPDLAAIARQNAEVIKHALKTKKKAGIAAGMGVSPSVVTEVTDAEIEKHANLSANCGYRLVPIETKVYPPDLVESMLNTQRHLMNKVHADQLALDQ